MQTGMGCEPLACMDVGIKRPKLGYFKTPNLTNKQYRYYRDRQVSYGAFELVYTDKQLADSKPKGGIGMVDLRKMQAFVQNDYEKQNITQTEQFFNPQKRRFD